MSRYGDYEQVNGAEVNALLDKIEQMRDALSDCAGGLRYIRRVYGDLYGVGWDRALGKADAVLLLSEETP